MNTDFALLKDFIGPIFEADGIQQVMDIFTHGERVIDIRGWGYFQYLKDKEGNLIGDKVQDMFSDWVARALTEQYKRDFLEDEAILAKLSEKTPDEKWPWVLWDSIGNQALEVGTKDSFTKDPDDFEGFIDDHAVFRHMESIGLGNSTNFWPLLKTTALALMRNPQNVAKQSRILENGDIEKTIIIPADRKGEVGPNAPHRHNIDYTKREPPPEPDEPMVVREP
jgi:hypothetical protein